MFWLNVASSMDKAALLANETIVTGGLQARMMLRDLDIQTYDALWNLPLRSKKPPRLVAAEPDKPTLHNGKQQTITLVGNFLDNLRNLRIFLEGKEVKVLGDKPLEIEIPEEAKIFRGGKRRARLEIVGDFDCWLKYKKFSLFCETYRKSTSLELRYPASFRVNGTARLFANATAGGNRTGVFDGDIWRLWHQEYMQCIQNPGTHITRHHCLEPGFSITNFSYTPDVKGDSNLQSVKLIDENNRCIEVKGILKGIPGCGVDPEKFGKLSWTIKYTAAVATLKLDEVVYQKTVTPSAEGALVEFSYPVNTVLNSPSWVANFTVDEYRDSAFQRRCVLSAKFPIDHQCGHQIMFDAKTGTIAIKLRTED